MYFVVCWWSGSVFQVFVVVWWLSGSAFSYFRIVMMGWFGCCVIGYHFLSAIVGGSAFMICRNVMMELFGIHVSSFDRICSAIMELLGFHVLVVSRRCWIFVCEFMIFFLWFRFVLKLL